MTNETKIPASGHALDELHAHTSFEQTEYRGAEEPGPITVLAESYVSCRGIKDEDGTTDIEFHNVGWEATLTPEGEDLVFTGQCSACEAKLTHFS